MPSDFGTIPPKFRPTYSTYSLVSTGLQLCRYPFSPTARKAYVGISLFMSRRKVPGATAIVKGHDRIWLSCGYKKPVKCTVFLLNSRGKDEFKRKIWTMMRFSGFNEIGPLVGDRNALTGSGARFG